MRIALLLLSACFATSVHAQETLTIVYGQPGGTVASKALWLCEQMGPLLKRKCVVEQRPGASGTIAVASMVQQQNPWTIVLTSSSSLVLAPQIMPQLGFEPLKLAPLSLVSQCRIALVVGPQVPLSVRTLADYMQLARADAQYAAIGTTGHGAITHFVGAQFAARAAMQVRFVQYTGGSPVMNDVVGGHIAAGVVPLADALGSYANTAVRILAATGDVDAAAPDVGSFESKGLVVRAGCWYALFGVPHLSREIQAAYNSAAVSAVRAMDRMVRDTLREVPVSSTSEELAVMLKSQIDSEGPLARTLLGSTN